MMASSLTYVLLLTLSICGALGIGVTLPGQNCLKIDDYDRLIEKIVKLECTVEKNVEFWRSEFLKQAEIIQELEAQLSNAPKNPQEKKPLSKPVAFSAQRTAKTEYEEGEVYVFTTPTLNEGSGYDSSTGYFEAPVAGTYMFVVQICNKYQHYGHVYIKAAGKVIVSATHAGSNDGSGACVSYTGVSFLQAGDNAWVECSHESSGFANDNWRWNMFTGVLL